MDLVNKYIIQSLVVAANNLRLNSEKIEAVAILREHLSSSPNIGLEIQRLKKITELSKLAIKLGEMLTKISNEKVDFLKLSDQFKEQSSSLVIILSNFLDIVSPARLREILKQGEISPETNFVEEEKPPKVQKEIIKIIKEEIKQPTPRQSERDELKEKIIFEGLEKESEREGEFNFEDFQKNLIKPIRNLEALLVRMAAHEYDEIEIKSYIDVIKKNADYAESVGFKLISNMHVIFGVGLKLIANRKLTPDKEIIESLRACLIVIVAVLKRKEVDVTNYLNKAEKFGEQILKYK